MDAWTRYERLWSKLVRIRWIHGGLESPEEDDILDQMDEVWSRLTSEEQVQMSAKPSRSLLRIEVRKPARALVDVAEDDDSMSGPRRIVIDESFVEELAA